MDPKIGLSYQLKKHFTYKWCCESNSEHIFRWFWDLSEYCPLHYRISLATFLCRATGHLFRQGCPSWYVWQCLFVDIFGCRIEYALHTCQVSVFVTPVQVFIPVPCYTSFRYLRGQRACFLLAAWTRTIPIFSSPICNTIWKSKNQNNCHWQCDTDYDV